jgi:hypothetical protein
MVIGKMVQAGGLEPPTSGSTDQRSNQLSYACMRDRLLLVPDPSGRNLGAARVFGKRGMATGKPLYTKPGLCGPGLG